MTETGSVPVIDIAPSFALGGRAAVAREIRTACEEIGFFAITGHGVPQDLIDTIRDRAVRFFALPSEVKMGTPQPPEKISRGYSWVGSRGLAYSLGAETPPDLQESFAMGPVAPAPSSLVGTAAERAFFYPNIWPDQPEDLREAFQAYYLAMTDLAAHVLRLFALALDLPEDHFDSLIDHHTSTMRAIHYPPLTGEVQAGQLRAGAHTDYGTLTILRGDDVPGGLQVKVRNGDWIDVHPPADGFVCNIGDLMMRWTNDHWISNLHRVAIPPSEARSIGRLSLVYFQNPNADALVECIRSFYRPGEQAKYPSEVFGDIFLGKHMRAQSLKKVL